MDGKKIIRNTLFMLCTFMCLFACAKPVKAENSAITGTDNNPEAAQEMLVSVYFLRAGKADSILIHTENHSYLIDTGTEGSLSCIFGALHMLQIEKLDAVFCTHTHNDHIGGLDGVLRNIPVETVYRSEISENNKNGINKIDKKAGREVTTLKAGDTIPVEKGICFEVLGPLVESTVGDNDNSLVLKMTVGNIRYLFTGDMQFAEEQTLLERGTDLKADVLKIGNHGNPDATSGPFAEAVAPKYCVVTTDRTVDADSANPLVLARFPDAKIYCTDETEQGILFTQIDNGSITVTEPFRKGEKDFSSLELTHTERVLILENGGKEQNLSGCMLSTESGEAFFCFPDGTILKNGESITISGEKDDGDFVVPGKKPFKEKKGRLLLFDEYGNPVREFD